MCFAGIRKGSAIILVMVAVFTALLALTWWFSATGRNLLSFADAGSAHRWLYRMPLTRLGDFMLGILGARLVAVIRGRLLVVRWAGPAAILGAVSIVWAMSNETLFYSAWSWDVVYVVPSLLLIGGLALNDKGLLARSFSWRPVVFLGEASFAFYLIHLQTAPLLGAGVWAGGFTPLGVTRGVVYLGAVLCCGVGVHVAIEKPAQQLIRRLTAPHGPSKSATGRADLSMHGDSNASDVANGLDQDEGAPKRTVEKPLAEVGAEGTSSPIR